ncbi:MAG TPA: sigma-70 family RNA polymerase sigma factor, partial [Kofleriaceae bacterium]|nr:sigma-70 family RNA polymerase sigma factor [Kofleriaceae bacterium]
LLAEIGWVRRLARALVRDDAVADDVAQDAWLLAMQHPPSDARPLRPWLHRVVRNVARMRHRAAVRREAREAAVEPCEIPSPDQLVERVELQRVVAGEVVALSEPYRSTVLLHFVEGLSSSEIARRLGVPDGTVRRRLKVALDQLRERLRARSDAPGAGWLAALVPLAQHTETGPAAATTLGVMAMKKLVTVVIVVVLLALTGAAVWWWHSSRSAEPSELMTASRATAPPRARTAATPPAAGVPPWMAQTGVAGRRVAGRVTAGGNPVAGAVVRLALIAAPDAVQPIADLRSGPDGAFDFGVQPAATFAVSAEAPRLTPSSVVIAVADPRAVPDQLALQLGACRSRLHGSVLDASGGGIARARLLSAELAGTESDERGRYSLCLPDHNSRVRVEADGYGTVALPFHLYGELQRDIVLVPEAVLVGQVVAGDHPVPGARVIATPDETDRQHQVATRWAAADRDGRFQIAGLAPGRFQLRAFADGVATATPQPALAQPAAASREIRIALEAVAEVRGRVVMAGHPVGGARIAAVRSGTQASASGFSQPDGSFTLSGALLGTSLLVARPYDVIRPSSLAITLPVVDGVVLEVRPLATVRGRVTRRGVPVAGADVTSARPLIRARTDATGGYVLEGLLPGSNLIHAVSLDARAAAEDHTVTLGVRDDRTLDIELEHAGEVTGRVVDQDGAPVPNVYVNLVDTVRGAASRGGESMTDATGAFDCWSMPAGDYLAAVYPTPFPAQPFAAATGTPRTAIHVPADRTVTGIVLAIRNERVAIRGRVVDDLGGEVPDVRVEAIAGLDFGNMTPPSGMSDAAGRFEIPGLARGAYRLFAHAADGSQTDLRDVAAPGEPVTLTLVRPGAIEGTLTGFSAVPVVDLRAEGRDRVAGRPPLVERDRFSAAGLSPGRYTVQARAGTEADTQTVEVRPGETTRIALRTRGLATLQGRITEFGSGAPVAGMRCDAALSVNGDPAPSPPTPALQA